MFRGGKDLRGVLQDGAGEAQIDDVRKLDVVVGEKSARKQKEGEDGAQDRQAGL